MKAPATARPPSLALHRPKATERHLVPLTDAATITQAVPGISPRDGTALPRCCLYLRASTTKKTSTRDGEEYRQRPEIQEERLRQLCAQRGWRVVGVYCDRASGRKETRPELTRLMQDARRGLFDVVAVAAFDRFARSSRHLLTALEEFRALKIDFISLREAIDTTTATGRLLFQITAAFAEFESTLISERTSAADGIREAARDPERPQHRTPAQDLR